MNALRILAFTVVLAHSSMSLATTIDEMLKQWNFQDAAATQEIFETLLESANRDPTFKAAVLSQIARTHSLRGHFDQAHGHLDEAEKLITQGMPKATTLVRLERGRTFNSNNQTSEAINQFRQAFSTSDSAGLDDLAVDAAHMMGIAEQGKRAERWNLIAMAIAETSEDPAARRWLGPLYNNLGWTYFDAGELDKALELFTKGVNFRKAINQTREWQIARWTVARTWRALGKLDEALAEQRALLNEVSKEGDQLGYINEEIGEIYLLKRNIKYSTHFAEAYAILSKDDWLVVNEADRLKRMKELGEVGG